jgi:hypothetical protein
MMQIVGKVFKTSSDFAAYVQTVKFGLWRPKFIVVHNTGSPNMSTYLAYSKRANPISDEQWMQNLKVYYEGMNWQAGPHVFVTPTAICAFSPLNARGTHSPSWNYISWGIETVGDFNVDKFDGSIRSNLIDTLAILHSAAGLQPLPYQLGVRGMHFHKEDVNTTHKDCPGKNMVKADLVAAVVTRIAEMHPGDHNLGE